MTPTDGARWPVSMFVIKWSDEDDAYVATAPDWPRLSGIGDHAASALAILLEAIIVADVSDRGLSTGDSE